jgi:hypothetical protein
MQLVSFGDRLCTEVDANSIRRFQRCQQVAAAAAQFKNPLAGRNEEFHELEIVFVVGGVELAPAIEFIAVGLKMLDEVALPLS